jgi:transketolase
MHTLKPLDEELIARVAAQYGALVTCENHSVIGGLGGAVAEVCARRHPVPMEFVGVGDVFGENGTDDYLCRRYGLDEEAVVAAIQRVLSRKASIQ